MSLTLNTLYYSHPHGFPHAIFQAIDVRKPYLFKVFFDSISVYNNLLTYTSVIYTLEVTLQVRINYLHFLD